MKVLEAWQFPLMRHAGEFLAERRRQGVARKLLRQALMQPGRPAAEHGETGVGGLMRQRASHGCVQAFAAQNPNADAAVVLAAVPLGSLRGLIIRLPALHDRDNTLLGITAKLPRDPRELVI